MNSKGIYTYPDGSIKKGQLVGGEFIASVDFEEALLN